MTDKETKELTEFGAEFLKLKLIGRSYNGFEYNNVYSVLDTEISGSDIFDCDEVAPILAHLAKRELAKRKLHWYASWKWDKENQRDIYFFQVITESPKLVMHMDENEYQCLWLAIRESVNEKDNSK